MNEFKGDLDIEDLLEGVIWIIGSWIFENGKWEDI